MAVVSSTPALIRLRAAERRKSCGSILRMRTHASPVFFPSPILTTSRDPLAAEIRGVETPAVVRAEKFFEHAREFRDSGRVDGLRF